MRIIDAHTHVGKPEFCEADNNDISYDLCATYEEIIEMMDENGVEKAVVLPIPYKDYNITKTNEYVMEAHKKYPDRLIPFCRIDENLEQNLKNGFRGVKLHLLFEGIEIKTIKKELQIIEDANVPLLVHPKFAGKVQQMEEILAYAPNITIILPHMGRGHIYTGEQVIENALGLKKYHNVYMDLSTVGDVKTIIEACEIIGYDRVLYATDYPFRKNNFPEGYVYSREFTELKQQLPADKADLVFSENIERLLNKKDGIIIRRAKKEDTDSIINIFNTVSDEEKKFLAYNSKISTIRQIIRTERHCYVAVIDDTIVGFLRESGRPNDFSLLEEIVVDPHHRQKGIASRLLEYYHRIFSKNLAKTNASNEKMKYILKKNGYIPENPDAQRIINWVRTNDNNNE